MGMGSEAVSVDLGAENTVEGLKKKSFGGKIEP